MGTRAWPSTRGMAGFGLLIAVLYLGTGLPHVPHWSEIVLTVASGLSGAVGVFIGLRRHRPSLRWPWWLIAGAFLSTMTGAILVFTGIDWPSPGLPDAFFLLQYPLLATAMVAWMRGQGDTGDVVAWIDVATILVAVGTLSWLFLIVPTITVPGIPVAAAVVAAAYTSFDLLVLGAVLRMVFGGGRAVPALLLIGSGVGLFLLGDLLNSIAYTYLDVASEPAALSALFVAASPLAGAAALHPSMVRLQRFDPADRRAFSIRRLPVLAAAMAVGPLALSIGHLRGDDQYVVVYAASSVVLALLVTARMWLLIQQQRRIAVTDALTGLRTRRYFEEALTGAVARGAFGVLLLDVDHFKRINDTRGHASGDRVLQELARRLQAGVRAGDEVARYGGEEFAVLLDHAGPEEAEATAERIRSTVAAAPIAVDDGGPPVDVTISVGVVVTGGVSTGEHGAEMMVRADRCLYTAKEQGRNRVVGASAA